MSAAGAAGAVLPMVRLLTYIILVMLGYFSLKSMLRGPQAPMTKPGPKDREGDKPAPSPPPTDPGQSAMVTDPVCGTYVEESSSLYLVHRDRKYFFCSAECRDRFLEDPPKA